MLEPSGEWQSDEALVMVYLDEDRVHLCKYASVSLADECALETIRLWLRL